MSEKELTLNDIFDMYGSDVYMYLWTTGWNMQGFKQEVYNAVINHGAMRNDSILCKKIFSHNFKRGIVTSLDTNADVDIVHIYMYEQFKSNLE